MRGFKTTRRQTSYGIIRDIDLLNFSNDLETLRDDIEARCSILKGELETNPSLGLTLGETKSVIDLQISNAVLNTEGVVNIVSITSNISNHEYKATLKIQTIYDKTIVVEVQ